MAEMGRVYEEVRAMIHIGIEDGLDSADSAMLRSKLREASEVEISSLLADFFDIELVVEAIHEQFILRGQSWAIDLRQKLSEALIFCGMEGDAEQVLRLEP